MKKKYLAAMIAIVMVMMLIYAFAAIAGAAEPSDTDVASVTTADGTTYYADFESALSAAQNAEGSTLTLLKNISLSETQTIERGNVTLDLGDYNLSGEAVQVFIVWSDAELTVKGQGQIICGASGHFVINNNGTLNIEGGIIRGEGGISNSGTLNVTGGNIITSVYESIANQGDATVSGGTFNGSLLSDGTMTVTGDALVAGSQYGFIYAGGTLDLSLWNYAENTAIFQTASETVIPGDSTIKLPEKYYFTDNFGDRVSSLTSGEIYIIYKFYAAYVITGQGTELFDDFASALSVAKATPGSTLLLRSDLNETVVLDSCELTFNLCGYEISADGIGVDIKNSKVTLMMGSVKGKTAISVTDNSVVTVNSSCDVTGEDVGIYVADSAVTVESDLVKGDIGVQAYRSEVTVAGADIEGAPSIQLNGCDAKIERGNLTGGIEVDETTELFVDGGNHRASEGSHIITKGNVTIVGGTFVNGPYAKIKYLGGVLDISLCDNVLQMSVSNGTGTELAVSDENIILPEGYALLDALDEAQTTLSADSSYIYSVGKAAPVDIVSVTTPDGTVEYSTFSTALDAAMEAESATVKLLASFEYNDHIIITKGNVTLDLNGKTLTFFDGFGIYVQGTADLTVTDSVGEGKVIGDRPDTLVLVTSSGGMTVSAGTFVNTGAGYALAIQSTSGTLTLSGGDFRADQNSSIIISDCTSAYVTGGLFTSGIYYINGLLDFSGHADPTEIIIKNGSGGDVSDEKFRLPDGYKLFDYNHNVATELTDMKYFIYPEDNDLPRVSGISFNSDSPAYDADTNTFTVSDDNPLIFSFTGENLGNFSSGFWFGVVNPDEVICNASPAVATDDLTITFTKDYVLATIEAFKGSDYSADIVQVGVFNLLSSPVCELLNLNIVAASESDEPTAPDVIEQSVTVKTVYADDSTSVDGVCFQVLDPKGTVLYEHITYGGETLVERLIAGEDYRLHVTHVPAGLLIPEDIVFWVDENGNVTANDGSAENGSIIIDLEMTEVKFCVVDYANGQGLAGATVRLYDANGDVVEEWVSDGGNHVIRGIEVNKEHTVAVESAPDGYVTASSPFPTFMVEDDGELVVTGRFTEDGVILVELIASPSTIKEVTFNSDSPAYDAETNTFTITKDHPLVVTVKGENLKTLGDTAIMYLITTEGYSDAHFFEISSDTEIVAVLTLEKYIQTVKKFGLNIAIEQLAMYFDVGQGRYEPLLLNVDALVPVLIWNVSYGEVSFEPADADIGDTVTLIVTPDEDYVLDDLFVEDETGKEIALSDGFSFVIPEGGAIVHARFKLRDGYHEKDGYDIIWSETFDGESVPDGFTSIDKDGDGYGWFVSEDSPADIDGAYESHGCSDRYSIASPSYINSLGKILESHNILVLPTFELEAGKEYLFSFMVKALDESYADRYDVHVSLDGGNTYVWSRGLLASPADWEEVTVDLSEYAGKSVTVVIEHRDTDMFILLIDCFYLYEKVSIDFAGELEALVKRLDEATVALEAAIEDGDKALDDRLTALTEALDAAKAALEKADTDVRVELASKIETADKALDDAIKAVQKNLDEAKAALEKAIEDGDKALDDKLTASIAATLEAAKVVLIRADGDVKAELTSKMEEVDKALDDAIKAVQKNLDDAKAELEVTDAKLRTFITVVCIISAISLGGCITLAVLYVIDKKKRV